MQDKISDALVHLNGAIEHLTLECYRGRDLHNMVQVDDFTIAEELKRIDGALGPRGHSMFASMAETIIAAYVEIVAARNTLRAIEASKGGRHG
jgi:hypothetical protein